MSKRYSHLPPGGGLSYDWSADHTFVKVSAEETDGMYTLMEDNLKSNFHLGLHKHETHAETFYILEGEIDFYIDGDWITAIAGSCLHIPPGIPHGCTTLGREGIQKMLMIYYLQALISFWQKWQTNGEQTLLTLPRWQLLRRNMISYN